MTPAPTPNLDYLLSLTCEHERYGKARRILVDGAAAETSALKAEVDGLRRDYESENHLLRLALDREEKLRAKAALADEYARDLIALREEDGDLFGVEATNGESIIGIETRAVVDWLHRYDALEKREEKA